MQLALIVCDHFCFSQQRLLNTFEEVAQRLLDFEYRLATEDETTAILATYKPSFLPLIVLGQATIAGVPTVEELEQWIRDLSST